MSIDELKNSQNLSYDENKRHHRVRGRLQRTSGKWGGGGFEISDIPGRGEGGGL